MKRLRLFVLSFYHIAALFATNAAVSKPKQTATPVDSLATHRTFFVPFGFAMVGERLCLSKARSNFGSKERNRQKTKFLRVPEGADL